MTHDLKWGSLKFSAKYKKYALQRLGQNSKEQMIFHCHRSHHHLHPAE
jgi:hypothetical protein